MGWNVSHGTNQFGEFRRSYGQMHDLAQHLAHVLPSQDWCSIEHVFHGRSGDPFALSPIEARTIASTLRRAAGHRLMPPDWSSTATELADAADRAADRGEAWEWR